MGMDVVCFGALNLDKLFTVDKIAGKEEEGFITSLAECSGGSAANTAVGLARLGLRVGFIGKVANDREGRILVDDFVKSNVDINGVSISGGRSGTVMGFVDKNGDRALYVSPGVNDELEFKNIKLDYVTPAKFLHMTSFVGKKSFDAQKKLVNTIRNVKISFDPGDIYARKGMKKLLPIIKKCFIILLNSKEIKLITGKGYKEGAKVLLESGVKIVVVKLGKDGCYVTDGKENHLIRGYRVKVVDTTGAGDAFNAGFLYGLIRNRSLYECGKIGNFVGSRCVMSLGARRGLPTLSEVRELS